MKPTIIAWLNHYDWHAATQSISRNADIITEASPAWYKAKTNGAIEPIPGTPVDDAEFLDIARGHGIAVRPLVMNTNDLNQFDRNLILRFFTDTSWGAKNIAAIITRAVQKNYCGVTLDYEDPGTVNLPLFAAFVRALAANLRINGITLAVAMEWKYAKEAAGAWQTIGEACETVAFMGYPEHNPGTAPGPLASLALLETRLKAVARSVPIQKIALGMATYAVRWSSNKATTGTWTSIVQPALANGTRIMRDKENAAPHFTDSMGVVWYEDAKSIQKKMQMAASLGISRFALWRLGGEDPEIWKMLRNQGL